MLFYNKTSYLNILIKNLFFLKKNTEIVTFLGIEMNFFVTFLGNGNKMTKKSLLVKQMPNFKGNF